MPEYEITFRLKDRPDLPKKFVRIYAPNPDMAREFFLEERPEVVIGCAPMIVNKGNEYQPWRL